MTVRLRCVSALFLVPVMAVSASAADAKKAPDPGKIFARKDANSDGSLTLEEFKTGLKDKALENAEKRFRKIDADGDGKLSLDEFKAGMVAKKS